MIKIKLNRAILMSRFSDFLGNRTINFRMFECLVSCFLRVTVSLLMPATSRVKDTCTNLSLSNNQCRETKLFALLIFTATKPRLSRNMLPNINKCENGCWYFSENLRIVALKLLELAQFASPNLSIYFNFVWCWGSVVMLTFLN